MKRLRPRRHPVVPRAACVKNAGWSLLGYQLMRGLLKVVAFSLGGFVVFGILRSQPYCEWCARYLVGKKPVALPCHAR